MFEIKVSDVMPQIELKSIEQLQELADCQLALVGGGTGAVNLE